MDERERKQSTSGAGSTDRTVRLAQQPQEGRRRQLRRSKSQKSLVVTAPPPAGAGQRRQARVRQLRTVKQLRPTAQSGLGGLVLKWLMRDRGQSRQLGTLRSHTMSPPKDVIVSRPPKVEVARVAQIHQRAATKSPKRSAAAAT
jgi:hypothetical protein